MVEIGSSGPVSREQYNQQLAALRLEKAKSTASARRWDIAAKIDRAVAVVALAPLTLLTGCPAPTPPSQPPYIPPIPDDVESEGEVSSEGEAEGEIEGEPGGPTEPIVGPYEDPSIPEALGNYVSWIKSFYTYRPDLPSNTEGSVNGAVVKLKTGNYDGGMQINLKNKISGNLSFWYSGSIIPENSRKTNWISIQFIEKGSWYGDDLIWDSFEIYPEEISLDEANFIQLKIPTYPENSPVIDKIVVMKVGGGQAEILMTDAIITNELSPE